MGKWMKCHLLSSHLVGSLVLVVDPAEVGHNDGHWQRDHKHTAEGTDGTKDLPRYGVWNHVPIPEERMQPSHQSL